MLVVLSIICVCFFISFIIPFTVHQFGALGMIGGDQAAKPSYVAFMADYGTNLELSNMAPCMVLSGLF
jgi:hypothetical protein